MIRRPSKFVCGAPLSCSASTQLFPPPSLSNVGGVIGYLSLLGHPICNEVCIKGSVEEVWVTAFPTDITIKLNLVWLSKIVVLVSTGTRSKKDWILNCWEGTRAFYGIARESLAEVNNNARLRSFVLLEDDSKSTPEHLSMIWNLCAS